MFWFGNLVCLRGNIEKNPGAAFCHDLYRATADLAIFDRCMGALGRVNLHNKHLTTVWALDLSWENHVHRPMVFGRRDRVVRLAFVFEVSKGKGTRGASPQSSSSP